ncbi:type II toxin-antitoxin system YafQ family toxin [Shewanella sp. 202IG2-18]|uniref:type II toxin-antitoxin system RelE/ParE family toxin n=1 Tax=Parashewanella hymeniacidonis TaxID=2807618 RepID=UPI001961CC4B|nr:type II toxin-antitoxin system YafQ family toxin [Parashewanella hymeniacidonis]MBM7070623.1 type II toxin-antitoxin system YafQ family toxin [Parashewanella hymeniacidonis]
MYHLEYSSQFKKDFKKVAKLAIPDVIEVGHIITSLQKNKKLEAKYVDHALSGNWANYRDCHIKPDLVLIYKIEDSTLKLARIGSHSELFR